MASESEDGQEKTEDPTERKLKKASEDGKVLSSKEMFVFTTLAMGLFMIIIMTTYGSAYIADWQSFFRIDNGVQLDNHIMLNIYAALMFCVKIMLIFGLPLVVITLATQAAVGGFIFAPKAMSFKGNRINPLSGLKRMFSVKSLVELAKSILKVVLLFGLSAVCIYGFLPSLLRLPDTNLFDALIVIRDHIPILIGVMLTGLVAISAIDYFWQRHTFTQELLMTKQELKDEYKQTEGSPEVKAKIRRKQMEASQRSAQQRSALDDVASATAIITNPTHFAVALKYEVGQPGAPVILAMGKGSMAARIIERGEEARVTVFRSPPLARALFFTGNIGQEISDGLYNAVAVVLAYIYRIEKGEIADHPHVELPDDLHFDEFGKSVSGEGNG